MGVMRKLHSEIQKLATQRQSLSISWYSLECSSENATTFNTLIPGGEPRERLRAEIMSNFAFGPTFAGLIGTRRSLLKATVA
jgi:hypothetical protein